MFQHPKFKSIHHKRAYYQNLRLKGTPGYTPVILDNDQQVETLSTNEKETIQGMLEQVAHHAFNNNDTNIITSIPFITNDITPLNYFKHVKNVKQQFQDVSLSKLVLILCQSAIEVCDPPIVNKQLIDVNRIMVKVTYPIEAGFNTIPPNMLWNVKVKEHDNYIEVDITDPILYYFVNKYGRNVVRPSTTKDLYLCGYDIHMETEVILSTEIERMFFEVGKAAFISSLLNNDHDLLGLTDVPGYYFGFGTYVLDGHRKLEMYRTLVGKDLLHVVPLWEMIFPFSYSYELTNLEIQYKYNDSSLLCSFIELKNYYVTQTSPAITESNVMSTSVTLNPIIPSMDPLSVYNANIYVRNKISSVLDGKDGFDKIKAKIFPNIRHGAVTKLIGLQSILPTFSGKSVLDLGAAPGTWSRYFADNQVARLVSVTRNNNPVDLKMKDDIVEVLSSNPNYQLIYDDLLIYLNTSIEKFDIIASDAATQKVNYYTQSLDHNALVLPILKSFVHLNQGGYLICKIFDLTSEILSALEDMSVHFESIKIIKPNGSCPTNNEKYIICQNYNFDSYSLDKNIFRRNIVSQCLHLIYGQMVSLHRLIKEGYNIDVTYSPTYLTSQLRVHDLRVFPASTHLLLSQLQLSVKLFSEEMTGTMVHETTRLNDKILRFKWNVPDLPFTDTLYVTETSIVYGSNLNNLPEPLIFHTGFIIQNLKRKHFIYLDKTMSFLFSNVNDDLIICDQLLDHVKDHQLLFSDLIKLDIYKSDFHICSDFAEFVNALRFISVKYVMIKRSEITKFGYHHIINQFFRECENMYLIHSISEDQSITTKSTKRRTVRELDLLLFSHQKIFVDMYEQLQKSGKTLKQTFKNILDQYSIKVPFNQLLQRSICYANQTYREYKTNQICISQPACVHLKRGLFI